MSEYKYRDKVSGQWISEAVVEQRILEFVTRGTLTPYDFVLICENKEDDPKEKKMIREVFPKAEDHWAMLRKIRVALNKLWEAQLDDPHTWDRTMLTLAAVYNLTEYAKIKLEYYITGEETGDTKEKAESYNNGQGREYQPEMVDNQLLVQFELNF